MIQCIWKQMYFYLRKWFKSIQNTNLSVAILAEVDLCTKAMAPHSSTLAWKIPWTREPGGLQSMGSRRVRHDWATSLSLFTFMHWRRKWQPTPVFLPGESQGWRSLVSCCLWGRTESDTTIFLVVLGLHCCSRGLSSCREQGLLFSFGLRASHCSDISCYRAQALGMWSQ